MKQLIRILPLVVVLVRISETPLPAQTFTTLLSFDFTNGANPSAGHIQGTDGNLYGSTFIGVYDAGSVFRLTPTGSLTTFHAFHYTGTAELLRGEPCSRLASNTRG